MVEVAAKLGDTIGVLEVDVVAAPEGEGRVLTVPLLLDTGVKDPHEG